LRGCCERAKQSLSSDSESKRPRGFLQEISPIDIHCFSPSFYDSFAALPLVLRYAETS
jgi:hypothetical protein